ncbi:unnamed protein product [Rotaria magnacalcarata]|uniref:Uncharacterized protein n=2 Tax=Rotaria magnacalcarata TaxID=392030 RepID=A0A818WJ73_9BILA|nr:unnamed protein product [Rotaria magnacalcarata]CAF1665162.1 unnamed protein product [Rotaria magnacalcarata]CAF2062631.1 unnamed protein product [Rotaria magnacalcarata]CAF2071380.1 unnamed protein product [Rotaria magnacalcarata]CAF2264628.1 unnamed protein product [Rotaria magnacalcarata]
MDLDPMISSSQEDYSYSDYDNRPIRPMNQEALNETLAKLPILIDEDDYNNRTNGSSDSSISIKARLTNRRQPILAYSTRRKNNLQSSSTSNTNSNQSLLHVNTTIGTPKSNKRKLGGCTPTVTPSANKVIKQLDCRQELIQLKEENKLIAQAKENLQIECALLKNSHETDLENFKQEHQKTIDVLVDEFKLQREQFDASIADKEQSIVQTNLELDNLRNDHTLLLVEKETLEKIVAEYRLFKDEMTNKLNDNEMTIKSLREEIEKLTKIQQQQRQEKKSINKSTLTNGRMPLKGTSTDRPRTAGSILPTNTNTNTKTEPNRSKTITKMLVTRGTKQDELTTIPSSSVNMTLNKSNSPTGSSTSTKKLPQFKSKIKPNVIIEDKKKSVSSVPLIEKRTSLISTRTRSKVVPMKS